MLENALIETCLQRPDVRCSKKQSVRSFGCVIACPSSTTSYLRRIWNNISAKQTLQTHETRVLTNKLAKLNLPLDLTIYISFAETFMKLR